MKLHRLRGRKTADMVLRRGRVWKGKAMAVRWISGLPRNAVSAGKSAKEGLPAEAFRAKEGLYVGTVTSLKLSKKAVVRNRMRRRCREALRIIVRERDSVPTAQLLIFPRSASLRAPFAALLDDVRQFLSVLR